MSDFYEEDEPQKKVADLFTMLEQAKKVNTEPCLHLGGRIVVNVKSRLDRRVVYERRMCADCKAILSTVRHVDTSNLPW